MSCKRCEHDWNNKINNGCSKSILYANNQFYEPVKVGDPGDWGENEEKDYCCPDCGAPYGTYHHANCDVERCPICGGQLWTCDCFDNQNEELAFAALTEIEIACKKNPLSYENFVNIIKKYNIVPDN